MNTDEWKPFDTAPKDGRWIEAWYSSWGAVVTIQYKEVNIWCQKIPEGSMFSFCFSHWRECSINPNYTGCDIEQKQKGDSK
jgi:hypothetical protein